MKTSNLPVEVFARSGIFQFQWHLEEGLDITPKPPKSLHDYLNNQIVSLQKRAELTVQLDGRTYEIHTSYHGQSLYGIIKDVTTYMNQIECYQTLAIMDPLTGVPNRLGLDQYFESIADTNGALFFIDLDNFKMLNDIYGHDNGDRLLQNITHSIRNILPERSFLSRVSGDEFVIYLQEIAGDTVIDWANRVLIAIQQANDQVVMDDATVTGSLGIALYPVHGETIEELITKADHAMYIAKKTEKGSFLLWCQTVEDTYLEATQQHELLYRAMKLNEFQFAYEPIVNLKENRIVAFEVWPFWEHPTDGLLHYEKFLRTVYEEGLVVQFEEWMLEEVMKELQRLNEMSIHILMTVNISPKHLANPNFHKIVRHLLNRYQIEPEKLGIEMVEFILLEEIDIVNSNFKQLKEMGVQIIIDGFGINYSTISMIDDIEFDYIKINKHFIKTIGIQESSDIIVSSITKIAKKHNKLCLAEGVINQDQIEYLLANGCIYGQGPAIIDPKPHDELVSLLKHWNYNKIVNNQVIID